MFVWWSLASSARSFTVGTDSFLKDGEKFQYISGSFHYWREIPENWEDRIQKMIAGGYNAIQTYVAWNVHEEESGSYNWEGSADLDRFLLLCEKYDLPVILRPGPYICGEWSFGGLPVWLHTTKAQKIRDTDSEYQAAVKRWFTKLAEVVKPHLYATGGSIIMVQLENEYGSYACNHDYMTWLADLWKSLLGDVLLFTTDGTSESVQNCGSLPSRAFATTDFGPQDPTSAFSVQRKINGGTGPYVCSEYWSGWFSVWGGSHGSHDADDCAKWFDKALSMGASVNVYMAFGGTSLYPGANGNTGTTYEPQPTSYDYDAPISESGDLTSKWTKMRDVVKKYRDLPAITVTNATKRSFGSVKFTEGVAFLDGLPVIATRVVESSVPSTFDSLGINWGYIYYESQADLKGQFSASAWDRAVLISEGKTVASAKRPNKIEGQVNGQAGVLVEHVARLNYGSDIWNDWKGLKSPTVGSTAVNGWTQYIIPMNKLDPTLPWTTTLPTGQPAFYRGYFDVSEPADTFLNPKGLTRGAAFINGVFIGNFWTIGPQLTLYVRAQQLVTGQNELVIFESSGVTTVPSVSFDNQAQLNYKP